MRKAAILSLVLVTPLMGGCLAKTAFDVVTAPVRVAGKAVDLATTSQSESDEKRGRDLRRREERLGQLERRYAKARQDCADGDNRACDDAQDVYAQMQELIRQIPPPPGGYERRDD
ncbi:MAG: hypothetical protein WA948_00715 [Pontixanthobacter sp.]